MNLMVCFQLVSYSVKNGQTLVLHFNTEMPNRPVVRFGGLEK